MSIEKILKNNKDWVVKTLEKDPSFFVKLSKKQRPKYLYIGCSDSRVATEEMMGAKPGEIFVHRNIANMVTTVDLSVMSVINYAVNQLKVKHIIVCGHYGCGGIQAAMEAKDLGILNPWLRSVRDVYRLHQKTLDKIKDRDIRYKKLVELNVQEQCINVIKTAAVQKAYIKRDIKLHGLVFDMSTGELKDLKINFKEIVADIRKIYQIV